MLQRVFEKFEDGTILGTDEDLTGTLSYMRERYIKKDIRNIILATIGEPKFIEIQTMLRQNGIFIWSYGELEDYYSKRVIQMKGSKDTKALELSYLLLDNESVPNDWLLNIDEIKELVTLILKKQ